MILLISQYVSSQHTSTVPDSVANAKYEQLSDWFRENRHDSVRSLLYAAKWLEKAKKEKNTAQKALAYKAMMHAKGKSLRVRYADSIVATALLTQDNGIIGSAYLTRGVAHFENKQHMQALDNYLKADKYIAQTNDEYLKYKIKYSIAHIKYYLGFYDEAISLFRECIEYFKDENDIAYLKSIHAIGLCYNGIQKYRLSTQYNQLGIAASLELELDEMIPYFKHSEGINKYFLKDFEKATILLNEILPQIREENDFANESVALFYLGKSHLALGHKEKAISYFEIVDKLISKHNYVRPDLRETYEILIDHFKNTNDLKQQLYYIDQLLQADKSLNKNYKYLSGKIFKEYDTKELLEARRKIEHTMQLNKIIYFLIIASLIGLVVYLIIRHRKNKRGYKKKFDELMSRKATTIKLSTSMDKDTDLDISPEVIQSILKNLEKFEQNKKFIEKDLTLVKLSGILNTNTKYASKVIARHRGKKTIDYITDLKIDYIIELLKNHNKYRNYTNKALAEEAGFGSTQNFTRAFNVRTGISPTYFIRELQKSQ